MLSNSQLTKLGERFRKNKLEDDDLQMLEQFRQTFSDIDQKTYEIIQDALKFSDELVITKRKRKTQQSIVHKLRRQEKLRLPQMQDIAGCRIVIQSKNRHAFGYQAIHIIVKMDKKFYEIQLRTYAQDIWANLVESLSNGDNTLKYGGSENEQALVQILNRLSEKFFLLDEIAHTISLKNYRKKIQEVMQNVLSNRA